METTSPTEKKQRCPDCGERAGVRPMYGMPTPEAMEAAARGEIALGGCIIPWGSPHFRCLACSWEWAMPVEPGDSEESGEGGPR